jgi:uncharacterized protein (DUF983 family)
MKGCYCPNCGERQRYRLDVLSKVEEMCMKCGKILLAQLDRTGIAVKAFENGSPNAGTVGTGTVN